MSNQSQISECSKYREVLCKNGFYSVTRMQQLKEIFMQTGLLDSCYVDNDKLSLMLHFKEDPIDIGLIVGDCLNKFYRMQEPTLFTFFGTDIYKFYSGIKLNLYYYLLKYSKTLCSINFV